MTDPREVEELCGEVEKQHALGHGMFCVGAHEVDGECEYEWEEWYHTARRLATTLRALVAERDELRGKLDAIDKACLAVCRDNTPEALGEPEEDMGRYVCQDEDGDALINTDEPAEVIAALSDYWERAHTRVDALTAQLAMALAENEALTAGSERLSRIVEVLRTERPVYVEWGPPPMPGGWEIGSTGGKDLIAAAEAFIAEQDAGKEGA